MAEGEAEGGDGGAGGILGGVAEVAAATGSARSADEASGDAEAEGGGKTESIASNHALDALLVLGASMCAGFRWACTQVC